MERFSKILVIIFLLVITSCSEVSTTSLQENYDLNATQIIALKDYFDTTVPENFLVRIQYNTADNIDFFVYKNTGDSTANERLFGAWNIDLSPYETVIQSEYDIKYSGKNQPFDSVLKQLEWKDETFKQLYEKLKKVNCIGISNTKPVKVEHGFMGMALLSYLLFDNHLTIEEQEAYSDDCMQLFYKKNVVFQYESGAIGSFCHPYFDRSL